MAGWLRAGGSGSEAGGYWDSRWIFSALRYRSQKSEHVTPRGMSRASREHSWVASACDATAAADRGRAVKSVPSFPTHVKLPIPVSTTISSRVCSFDVFGLSTFQDARFMWQARAPNGVHVLHRPQRIMLKYTSQGGVADRGQSAVAQCRQRMATR